MNEMKTLVKDWYVSTYPKDLSGHTLDSKVTFQDVFDILDSYGDIYTALGGDVDSVIRERVFEELSKIVGMDYDYIYEQWLKSAR